MEKKTKIAVIGLKGLPAFGGAASVGENIINQLKKKYDFTVYSISSHTELRTGNYEGIRQIVFKKLPFKKLNSLYYYLVSMLHVLLIKKYDLIHLHHYDAAFIIIFLRIRYKVLITIHGFTVSNKWKTFIKYFDLQKKCFLRFADKITAVSINDAKYINAELGSDAIYIPNGIDLTALSDKIISDRIYLLFSAARIIDVKGCDILLRSLSSVNQDIKTFIIGDLNWDLAYSRYIKSITPKRKEVEFLGFIQDKISLNKIISGAKLFVFPSRNEAMSMMLLEVAALKTPIICSDIEANKNIFDEKEVVFFKSESEHDLAHKINWALDHPDELNQFVENAFIKIRKNYNIEIISKQYQKLYEALTVKNVEV